MSTRPPEQAGLNGEAHSICLQGQGRGHGHQPQGQLRHGEGLLIITRGGCLAELRAGSEHQTEAEEDSEPGLRAELRTGAPILPAGGAGAAPPSSRGSSGAGEGGSLHPASCSTGGDWALGCPRGSSPPFLGCRQELAWARGRPLLLCRELRTGQAGASAKSPSMGQGAWKHTGGDGGGTKGCGNSQDQRVGLGHSRLRKAAE